MKKYFLLREVCYLIPLFTLSLSLISTTTLAQGINAIAHIVTSEYEPPVQWLNLNKSLFAEPNNIRQPPSSLSIMVKPRNEGSLLPGLLPKPSPLSQAINMPAAIFCQKAQHQLVDGPQNLPSAYLLNITSLCPQSPQEREQAHRTIFPATQAYRL